MKHWSLAFLLAAAPGCSLIVDGAIHDPDDGGMTRSCDGASDGTPCGGGQICVGGVCALSDCGDDYTDTATGEVCDDGNDVPLDGCEPDCTFSCAAAADCDDGLPCNGTETCDGEHVCRPGTALAPGATCTQPGGDAGVCRGSDCVAVGCGNMLPDFGEECDDGNMMPSDGCEPDCTYTCEADVDCDDSSVCTGTETCDGTQHLCVAGTELPCDDSVPCTSNECDPVMGCVFPLIDEDGDNHASTTLGACGTDCNDMRADVNPDATELCGDALDSDCDGENNPASTPTWYVDCDMDTYAALGAASQVRCDTPDPSSCGGTWTTRVPVTGDRSTYDCNDANMNVRPSQSTYFTSAIAGASASIDYDYNCDLVESRRYTATGVTAGACTTYRGGCSGAEGWSSSSAPSCGGSGTYSYCRIPLCLPLPCVVCTRGTVTRTQSCR